MNDDLTTLFHDAVEDVEPTDRLAAIRQQTQRPSRRRWYAAGGAVLATAAVVTGIAIAARPQAEPGPGPSKEPTASVTPRADTYAMAVYYLGETPWGPRLFREFHQRSGELSLPGAVNELSTRAEDADYVTHWEGGEFDTATIVDGVIRVMLADPGIGDQPGNLTALEARLSVEQVIYTVQAAAGANLPVQFTDAEGNPVASVLGVATSEPLDHAPQPEVLALVSVSDPAEGRIVHDSFTARGRALSFEGTVPWELRDADGALVREGVATGSFDPEQLTEWETEPIDVSDLPAGRYVFEAMTADPSGGAEGAGPWTDTRAFYVQ